MGSFFLFCGDEWTGPSWLDSKPDFFSRRVLGVNCLSSHGFFIFRNKCAKPHFQIRKADKRLGREGRIATFCECELESGQPSESSNVWTAAVYNRQRTELTLFWFRKH